MREIIASECTKFRVRNPWWILNDKQGPSFTPSQISIKVQFKEVCLANYHMSYQRLLCDFPSNSKVRILNLNRLDFTGWLSLFEQAFYEIPTPTSGFKNQ